MISVVCLISISCSYETGYLYQKQPFNQRAEIDPEEVPPPRPVPEIPVPPGPPSVPERPGPLEGPDARPPAPDSETIPGPPGPPTPPTPPGPDPDHDTRPPAPGFDPIPGPPGPPVPPPEPDPIADHDTRPPAPGFDPIPGPPGPPGPPPEPDPVPDHDTRPPAPGFDPIPGPPGPPVPPPEPDPIADHDTRPPAPGFDPIPGPPGPPVPPPEPDPIADHDTRPPAPGFDPIPGPPGPPVPPPAPPPGPDVEPDPSAPTPLCSEFTIEQRAIEGTDDADLGVIGRDDCPDLNLHFDPASRETIAGSTRFRPLALYFVLDTTGSMSSNIAAVRNGILGFVDRLEADGFDVQLGLTTFDDTVLFVDDPTRDVVAFRARVGGLIASGGGDGNEASLIAMQRTYEKMSTLDDDVVKAALVVTDEIGHTGELADTSLGRNCDIRPLVNYLNSLPEDQQQMQKIFYSVDSGTRCGPWADGGGDPVAPWATAHEQWEAVLDQALPSVDRTLRGGALDYPPTPATIIDDFADLLIETTPDIEKVCLAREATLTLESGFSQRWTAPSASAIREIFERGERVTDWFPLFFDDIDSHRGQSGQVTLARCCFLEEDLDSASFAACTDERIQTVHFTLAP